MYKRQGYEQAPAAIVTLKSSGITEPKQLEGKTLGSAANDSTFKLFPIFAKFSNIDASKVKIVSVDALPAELAYVDKGLAPVLLAQPVYQWGYVGVKTIFDKVHNGKQVPEIIPMELVKVTKDNLGTWARQLQAWGFTDVNPEYLKRP